MKHAGWKTFFLPIVVPLFVRHFPSFLAFRASSSSSSAFLPINSPDSTLQLRFSCRRERRRSHVENNARRWDKKREKREIAWTLSMYSWNQSFAITGQFFTVDYRSTHSLVRSASATRRVAFYRALKSSSIFHLLFICQSRSDKRTLPARRSRVSIAQCSFQVTRRFYYRFVSFSCVYLV